VVIDNRAGASGSIGATAVARAKPDGYTVLYDASSFAINPALRKLPYDPAKDFIPVSQAIRVPNILVAAPAAPYNNLSDFVRAAQAQPGRHTYASYGPGSLAQMAGELLKIGAKIDAVHVPYKGGAPAIVDVMGGQVDVYFANAASSLGYVKAGKLKALAVSSRARMPELPSVPTVRESGIKDFEVEEWNGFFACRHRRPAAGAGAEGPGAARHQERPGKTRAHARGQRRGAVLRLCGGRARALGAGGEDQPHHRRLSARTLAMASRPAPCRAWRGRPRAGPTQPDIN
jgi:hypothetical protein